MKRLTPFFIIPLLSLGIIQVSFAQDSLYNSIDYSGFQFTTIHNNTTVHYGVTGYNYIESNTGLLAEIYQKHQKNHTIIDSTCSYGMATVTNGNQKEFYFSFYDDAVTTNNYVFTVNLYDQTANWLYTLTNNHQLSKKRQRKLESTLNKYVDKRAEYYSTPEVYAITSASGKNYYLLELSYGLKDAYQVAASEYAPYGEFAFRLLLDKNLNVVQEIAILGDGTELRELQFQAPIILP